MVIIDSDVLLLAFAFPNDDRQKLNQKFLELAQTAQPATMIYNLMEVLGQLSLICLRNNWINGRIGW